MATKITRTFIAEFILKGDDGGERRVAKGERVPLTPSQFERAAKAETVHRDAAIDADVAVLRPEAEAAPPQSAKPGRDRRARSVPVAAAADGGASSVEGPDTPSGGKRAAAPKTDTKTDAKPGKK
jgi:hypothetical protein